MRIGRRPLLAGLASVASGAAAIAPTAITVQFAWPETFKPILRRIAAAFTAANPDVNVQVLAPAADYEVMAQQTLRAALTGDLPDVAFHGMHRVGLFAERNLLAPLQPLIAADPEWHELRYEPSVLSLARYGQETYGLPFAMSIEAVYFNLDLVRRAGGDPDALPGDWEGIIALQRRIQALGAPLSGLYFDYYYPDNNFSFHGLVNSQGGRMESADERGIGFDGPEGMQALRWLHAMGQAGMIDMTIGQAYQAFAAGSLGILVASSSRIVQLMNAAQGRFAAAAVPIPVLPGRGRLPAGGAAAMIHAQEPAKLAAAWRFIKFATGPIGAAEVIRGSGYIPGTAPAAQDAAVAEPYRRRMLEQLPIVTRFYTWPGENSLKIPVVIRDHLQRLINLKTTPEAVMPVMTHDVLALLPA